MTNALSGEAAALAARITGWRRDFHRRPETAFKEIETSAVLKKFFGGLGCSVRTLAGTGPATGPWPCAPIWTPCR